jgi:cell wall-associated NlpC family hydrolase
MQQEQRDAVVKLAKEFVGTKFVHQGRVRGAGVDCAGLIEQVYAPLDYMPLIVWPPYGKDWYRHAEHEEKYIVETAKKYFDEITEAECAPGDWITVKVGRAYAHCAIVTSVKNGKPWKAINAWPVRDTVWEVDCQQDTVFAGRLKRYWSPRWK